MRQSNPGPRDEMPQAQSGETSTDSAGLKCHPARGLASRPAAGPSPGRRERRGPQGTAAPHPGPAAPRAAARGDRPARARFCFLMTWEENVFGPDRDWGVGREDAEGEASGRR